METKKTDRAFFWGIAILTISLVFGGVFLAVKLDKNETVVEELADAKVEVGELAYDWGEIGLNDGKVEKEFEIKNSGTSALSLFNISTSCMCTTAQIVGDSSSSPVFGMHSKSEYVYKIDPGKSAKVKVIFDPAFHGPSGVGPITRQIKLETNDKNYPEVSFTLNAVVKS